jgi:hypothetical protein
MVVHQIDIPSVTCLKPEDQTPIARDGEAPEAAPIAPEWMQTPLRLLKNKGFKEERMTKVGLYAIG